MKYSKGYKYQLKETVVIQTALLPLVPCVIQGFILLNTDGKLYIYKGYAWDGVTHGIDFKFAMIASLVHDALFQLMQEGLLPLSFVHLANLEFRKLMIISNAPKFIAELYYQAVDHFGVSFATWKRVVYEA